VSEPEYYELAPFIQSLAPKRQQPLEELELLLQDEATRIEESMAGTIALTIHILDLRPRLPKEKN